MVSIAAERFGLDQVYPWGRGLAEYRAMFALDEAALRSGRILDCAGGPAAFAAEAAALDARVVAADPIYRFSAAQLRGRIEAVKPEIMARVRARPELYVWSEAATPESWCGRRLAAMEIFLTDLERAPAGRYVEARLPRLPFADGSFALALCSHFLFLYGRTHDTAMHIEAVRELRRVAEEVRVFPLIDLENRPSEHLGPVRAALESAGFSTRVQPTGYEFQRGGDAMLVVR